MSREIDLIAKNSLIFYVLIDVIRNNGDFNGQRMLSRPPELMVEFDLIDRL